ncbi:MAG TPA: GldG family protein, partial [Gammaproteobacteria bacterium]|nr:GldG family protein [Gammaproteobacteria bacterium]
MAQLSKKKILTGSILAFAIMLFLAINVLSGALFKAWRLDLTGNKIYTLSAGSKEIVAEINEPIILRLYFSKRLANINPYLISFATRVQDLLQQYQRISKGKVIVEIIDPEPFSPAEDEAVNYGLQGIPVDSTGTEFYLGLVGTDALNDQQIIPFLQPSREQNLEYDVSQLIYKLVHPQPRGVAVMTSVPLDGGMNSRPWAVWQQMQQLFSLQMLDHDATEIPANISTLMIVEPSTFTKDALKAIDKFVMRGGHVLAFVDPVSEVADRRQALLNKTRQKDAGDYIALLKSWGVDFDEKVTVADRDLAKTVRAPYEGREVTIRYPLWMDFTADNFAQEDVLSANLDRITLATPGALKQTLDATTTMTSLISTSDQAMLLESKRVDAYQQNLQQLFNDYKATGKYIVAARISGPIKSLYTDARVNDSSIIVIADTDMLHDHFWINVQNIMGQDYAVPAASNGNLV